MGGWGSAGIGLAKMMEGVSGGALAGKQMEYKDQILKTEQANEAERVRREEEQARFSKGVSTLNTAYHLASNSPDPKAVFRSVQEKLNPGGEIVDIDFPTPVAPDVKEPEVTLIYPGSVKGPGWKVSGPKSKVSEVFDLASKNPKNSDLIIKKALSLGVLRIEQQNYEAPKLAGGGGRRGDRSGDGGVKALKVSDFVVGIKSIGAKYSVDTSGGFVVGADGAVSVNPSAMMGGKTTAYNAIKKLIRESADPAEKAQAQADLKKIDYYYGQIDKTLGAPDVPARTEPPVVPGGGSGPLTKMMGLRSLVGTSKLGPIEAEAEVPGLPGVREKDVEATMNKYGMSRGQVIKAYKDKKGKR